MLFVIVFAVNLVVILLVNLALLVTSQPFPIKLSAALHTLLAVYGVVSLALLVARHPRAPLHAIGALTGFFFVGVGAWLYLSSLGADLAFPVAAVVFPCFWIGYLSVSRRVRLTYTPPSRTMEGSATIAASAGRMQRV